MNPSRRQFLGLAAGVGAAGLLRREAFGSPPVPTIEADRALTGDGMKSILFFDDWMLHRRDGLDRHWHQPTFVKEIFSHFYPGFLGYGGYMTVFHDARVGRYVMYLAIYPPEADVGVFVVRLESDDPYNWADPVFTRATPTWKGFKNVVLDQRGERFWPFSIQPLAGTPLADQGYIAAQWYKTPAELEKRRQIRQHGGSIVGPAWPPEPGEGSMLAFSPDGLRFEVGRDHPWRQPGADVPGTFAWNQALQQYVIYTRRLDVDRRICYATTADFRRFSPVLTAIQPDALDPLGTEFYEMPVRPYEDLYLGMLHVMQTEPGEKKRIKMVGNMQTQLAHSYNGVNWVRPTRDAFMPVRDYGQAGGGTVYGMEMLRTRQDRLLFFANSSIGEHASYPDKQAAGMDVTGHFSPLLYEMRLDGFCSLRTNSRDGLLETKTLIPQSGELSLNLRTTPHTSVRVQLLDGQTLDPLPGYTLAEAVPIRGDHLFAPVRWKDAKDLSAWVGKPVRLVVEMREAEIFAIRMKHKAFYAGEFMPGLASLA